VYKCEQCAKGMLIRWESAAAPRERVAFSCMAPVDVCIFVCVSSIPDLCVVGVSVISVNVYDLFGGCSLRLV
jgi:hypothetical protein